MIKKLFCVLLILCFTAAAACTGEKKAEPTPAPTATVSEEPTATVSEEPTATASPAVKSEADLEFEKLSNEIFVSVATSDGFTYHQFVKNPASFGIDESAVELGWGSLSLEAHEADYAENDELLKRFSEIDRNELSPANANAYDTLLKSLELSEGSKAFYYYSEPLEVLNGSHTMLPLMMTMYEISSVKDLDGYMYLLEDMPRYIGEIAEFEKQKAGKGLFMTENALDTVLGSIGKFIDSGEDCFLISFLDDTLEKGVEGVSKEQAAAYSERSRDCVLNKLIPAYSALKNTLTALRPSCGRFVGAAERSDEAKAWFASSIKTAAAVDMSPEEMEKLLTDTADELIFDMIDIVYSDRGVIDGFGNKTVSSGDPDSDIEYLLEIIKPIYPSIPTQSIEYVEVPDAVADDFSPAAYLISAFDDSSRNIVIINPSSDTRTLLFTMAHECFPGHLYQTQYTRNGGFPLAQQIVSPSGYSEGWAVFSELMVAKRAERYGVNACLVEQYNSIASNIIFPALISLKVNYFSFDKERLGDFLAPYGLDQEEYIDIIYEYAVNMPDYFFNYGMGFANTYRVYRNASPENDSELREFLDEYLSLGPCCFDVIFKRFGIED